MKKLILVTLLAVSASWLLHEARQSSDPRAVTVILENGDTYIGPIGQPAPLVAPVPPVPPRPPEPIRTTRRRQSDGPRAIRATTAQSPPTAKQAPSWFPKSEIEEETRPRTDAFGSRVVVGRVSASEDRARQDLRLIVEREVSKWLAADVATSWKVPANVLDSMVQASYVQEVTRSLSSTGPESVESPSTPEVPGLDNLYTLYRAGQKLDFSPSRRAEIVGMYRHDLATQRLQRLGGGLALALVGLAVLSGYIKADEATKGYYTNRLRLAAAVGLGAAGAAAYRFLV